MSGQCLTLHLGSEQWRKRDVWNHFAARVCVFLENECLRFLATHVPWLIHPTSRQLRFFQWGRATERPAPASRLETRVPR